MSKKIKDNIDAGLWAHYGDDYVASAWQDPETLEYAISLSHEGLPPFRTERYTLMEDLEVRMRSIQPDLRKWHTKIEA